MRRVGRGLALLAALSAAAAFEPVREAALHVLLAVRGCPPALAAVFAAATASLVPFWVLAIATGFLLGPWTGGAVALAGNLGGAMLAWGAARTVARESVQRSTLASPRWAALLHAVRERGFLLVLVTRLSPFIPSNTMNWVFGAGGVPAGAFAAGSALGMLPTLAAYVYLGSTLPTLGDLAARLTPFERGFLGAALAVSIAVTAWIGRFAWRAARADRGSVV